MDYIIKPDSNKIEYHDGKDVITCSYILKNITFTLTADDPYDLSVLMKRKKQIQKAIVDELNKNVCKTNIYTYTK